MTFMKLEELRRRAEARFGHAATVTVTAAEQLVRELQVHQVELEMQNEQLQSTQVELEASRERYEDLFSFAPVGYLVLGSRGIIECNDTAARLLGLRRGELVGVPFETFLAPESASAFALHRRAVLESMEQASVEVGLVTRSGQRRELRIDSVCTSAIRQQWRAALVDVTDQRRLERQLADAMRVEVAGPVTRAVAHDVRHVLMTILASADAALKALAPEHAARRPIDDLKRITLKAGAMMGELLDRARGRRGAIPLSDLDQAVRQADAMLRRAAGPEVRIVYALDTAAAVELTEPEIDQILLNLVSNARDALPRGGEIELSTARAESWPTSGGDPEERVVLSVRDSGVGMDAATLRRAFEPFFSTKPPERGSGLGLSTVQAIVARRGGEVELVSEPGQGTTVRVLLPRSNVAAIVPEVTPPAGDVAPAVLVVDDHDFVRLAARRSLEKEGYRVVLASSGEQALEFLAAAPASFSLLLSDVDLPKLSGPELIERARALIPDLRCLLMSGIDPLELVRTGEVQSAAHVIKKPFRPTELVDRVGRALVPSPIVLVVEDDPLACATYRDLLTHEGFRVVIARSGRDALEACDARRGEIAIVMSDFNLPDLDGATLLEALRRTYPNLPVLFVTGRSSDDPALEPALSMPAVRLLTKPVDIGTLARALRTSLAPA